MSSNNIAHSWYLTSASWIKSQHNKHLDIKDNREYHIYAGDTECWRLQGFNRLCLCNCHLFLPVQPANGDKLYYLSQRCFSKITAKASTSSTAEARLSWHLSAWKCHQTGKRVPPQRWLDCCLSELERCSKAVTGDEKQKAGWGPPLALLHSNWLAISGSTISK